MADGIVVAGVTISNDSISDGQSTNAYVNSFCLSNLWMNLNDRAASIRKRDVALMGM
jgi:hypothetical protein